MASILQRIGIPTLGFGSFGGMKAAEALTESPIWQLAVEGISMLAGLTAIIWAVARFVAWCKKRKK